MIPSDLLLKVYLLSKENTSCNIETLGNLYAVPVSQVIISHLFISKQTCTAIRHLNELKDKIDKKSLLESRINENTTSSNNKEVQETRAVKQHTKIIENIKTFVSSLYTTNTHNFDTVQNENGSEISIDSKVSANNTKNKTITNDTARIESGINISTLDDTIMSTIKQLVRLILLTIKLLLVVH